MIGSASKDGGKHRHQGTKKEANSAPEEKSAGSTGPCSFCKGTNHSVEKCFKKKKAESLCRICKQKGHYARECKSAEKQDKPAETPESAATMLVWQKPAEQKTVSNLTLAEIATHPTVLLTETEDKEEWVVDSGATQHMSNNLATFQNSRAPGNCQKVHLGNSSTVPVERKGEVSLRFVTGKARGNHVTLTEVLGVPELAKNLLSVSACMKKGFSVLFDHETYTCRIFNKERLWGVARERGGLWIIDCKPTSPTGQWACSATTNSARSQKGA